MKLDDLKHLPILTKNILYEKNELRKIIEIAEIKTKTIREEYYSTNYVAYVIGLIKPGLDFCDITGNISKNKNFKDHTLIWYGREANELINGITRPIETFGEADILAADLSEILEYNILKKL